MPKQTKQKREPRSFCDVMLSLDAESELGEEAINEQALKDIGASRQLLKRKAVISLT